jgi:hypothetical protein
MSHRTSQTMPPKSKLSSSEDNLYWGTTHLDVVDVWETIESVGPGTTYSCDDGITRFKPLGSPTATISRLVSVTHRHSPRTQWLERSHSSTLQPETPKSTTPPLQTEPSEPQPNFGDASCKLYHSHRFCLQNTTDMRGWNGTGEVPDGCMEFSNECRARFTNEEVVLIYWRPKSIPKDSSREICAHNRTLPQSDEQRNPPRIAVLDEIIFRGQDRYFLGQSTMGSSTDFGKPQHAGRSTMKGPFTFTSPTIYVAHHEITFSYEDIIALPNAGPLDTGHKYALGLPDVESSVRPAGILAMHSTDVSSIRANRRTDLNEFAYASLVASGKYRPEENGQGSDMASYVPFNFADLQDPVPASAYLDARAEDCWYEQSHCQTLTDGNYRPRLVLASKAWKSYSRVNYDDCIIPNLVDPPVALEAIDDETPAEPDAQLPPIHKELRPFDQMAAVATAPNADYPGGTSMSLEPGPVPANFWPSPTATGSSMSGSMRGENQGPGLGMFSPKGTRPEAKDGNRYGLSNNGGVALTSGSSGAQTAFWRFTVGKWIYLISLYFFTIIVM